MKQFTSVHDVTDVSALVQEAMRIKANIFGDQFLGRNKTLGLIFFNPSIRTRLSTQKAALNLGMHVIVMNIGKEGWNIEFEDGAVMRGDTQEHIKDAVGVISSYCDILGVRTFAGLVSREEDYQERVLHDFIKYSSVPVVSLESATLHPLQSLADMITIAEQGLSRPKIVVSWAPHPRALPQAVTNSFLQWVQYMDAEVVLTHPKGYELDRQFTRSITLNYDQHEAFQGADFVYVKNWSSYRDYGARLGDFDDWIITKEKMDNTSHGKFMHCMPIRRNVVATDTVIDNSIIQHQAANRTISAQAVLKSILQNMLK